MNDIDKDISILVCTCRNCGTRATRITKGNYDSRCVKCGAHAGMDCVFIKRKGELRIIPNNRPKNGT